MILKERFGGRKLPHGEAKSSRQPAIIYFNIGWMKHYAAFSKDDETKGGHGYLKNHLHGGEAFNFAATEAGTVRGYRPPGGHEKTNITKMGAAHDADLIEGALVVWIAKEPASGRVLIVGWYRNATVFRVARDSGIDLGDDRIYYSAEAAVSDATLLPPLMRTFQVESSRTQPGAGFGQKPTWYGAKAVDEMVWAYIGSYGPERQIVSRSTPPKPPKNLDPELRRRVEKAAVTHAITYYKELYGPACVVQSVESQAKGWDLEVFAGPEPLLIEVKGLMNSAVICELTPNEYEQMMLPEYTSRYIVYIVSNALAEPPAVPVASIFEYASRGKWAAVDGRKLVITPKIAAVLSC